MPPASRTGLAKLMKLAAVGHTPPGEKISAAKAGVDVTDCGFMYVDIQLRTDVPHIFAIGEIALALEMGADAMVISNTIHPHPALGESIGMAMEIANGSCTDVPPARK